METKTRSAVINLPPLDHFLKMTMSVDEFIRRLKDHYILSREDMARLNYPVRTPALVEWNPRGRGNEESIREHTCSRCGQFFYTTEVRYLTMDKCSYHPGKLYRVNGPYGQMQHSCCKMPNSSHGCATANLHVWAGPTKPLVNSSYVETKPPRFRRFDGNYGVYSLDCEMGYTVAGLEVIKITLVDITGKPVYNEYVKPISKVVDFNTEFSGVRKNDFIKHGTKTLMQVQRELKQFICNETVLIGHGLENDLKAMKILHKTVVDTAFVFPHFRGFPFRRSLKNLARCCLKKDIQSGPNGHDPCEDARTCMDLMLLRLNTDFSNELQ